jgi:hypothetical protein
MSTATIEGTESPDEAQADRRDSSRPEASDSCVLRTHQASRVGVGPGNVPVCIERTADVPKAVQDILTASVLTTERSALRSRRWFATRRRAGGARTVQTQGAHFLSAAEADQLGKVVATPQRSLNPAIVGSRLK